jgi:hypothetical protein
LPQLGETNNSPDNASNADKQKGCDEKSPLVLKSSKDQKTWIYEPASSFIGSNANHLLSQNITSIFNITALPSLAASPTQKH